MSDNYKKIRHTSTKRLFIGFCCGLKMIYQPTA